MNYLNYLNLPIIKAESGIKLDPLTDGEIEVRPVITASGDTVYTSKPRFYLNIDRDNVIGQDTLANLYTTSGTYPNRYMTAVPGGYFVGQKYDKNGYIKGRQISSNHPEDQAFWNDYLKAWNVERAK